MSVAIYLENVPNLMSRRQYNDRREYTKYLYEKISNGWFQGVFLRRIKVVLLISTVKRYVIQLSLSFCKIKAKVG